MIQFPTKDVFKARALAAIDAGQLQCQQPDFERGDICSYSGPCVIGSVLEPVDRTDLDNYSDNLSIGATIETAGLIAQPNWISVTTLIILQDMHDRADVVELRAKIEAL